MSHPSPAPASPAPPAARARILAVARGHLFAYGYSAALMDELARELGMSKKTLYRPFPRQGRDRRRHHR